MYTFSWLIRVTACVELNLSCRTFEIGSYVECNIKFFGITFWNFSKTIWQKIKASLVFVDSNESLHYISIIWHCVCNYLSGLLGVNLLNHGLIIIHSCVVKRKQFWGRSQVLTGGCCKEVGLCYKNWNWDSKIVVAMDRWSLFRCDC